MQFTFKKAYFKNPVEISSLKKKNPTTGLITALQEERNMKQNRRHSGCRPVKFSTISHNNMQACLHCWIQCRCSRTVSGLWSCSIDDKMASGQRLESSAYIHAVYSMFHLCLNSVAITLSLQSYLKILISKYLF